MHLFHSQPSPNILQSDHSFRSVGEATQEQMRGSTFPLFPTHYLHPYPHQGVMQVTQRDSPQGASWATSMAWCKEYGHCSEKSGCGSKRQKMNDSRSPSILHQSRRHSICCEQTLKDSGWVWLPTDRSAAAGILLEKAGGERTVMLESRRNVISKAKSCELDEHS